MRAGLQEIEIKSGLASGGHISRAFITSETDAGLPLYRVYMRPSWFQQFLPLRSWADRSDRVYRDLNRAVRLIRDFGYRQYIAIYEADDPRLARYEMLAPTARTHKPNPKAVQRKPPPG